MFYRRSRNPRQGRAAFWRNFNANDVALILALVVLLLITVG